MKNSNPSPGVGDLVKIKMIKKDYEGILLETPKDEKGIYLLKLKSGYNIGINKKDSIGIEVLKKSEKKIVSEEKIKSDSSKPNLAMIITGGTIASTLDTKTGAVHPLQNPEELFKFYPEMFKIVNVARVKIPFMKASEDMDYKDWQKIAKTAEKLLNDSNIQGVIITHGTDTLHYTSSALSFFLRNLNKPVVLTYSQRSIDRASSDANLNLKCSALAAISDIAEVMLVGHGSTNDDYCLAMPGTKVRKLHTSRRDAFKVVNGKEYAKIDAEKNSVNIVSHFRRRNKNKVKVDSTFEEKVALVKIYPGIEPNILDFYVKEKYKGIVLELSGLGHAPSKESRNNWLKKISEVTKKGIAVVGTSQCINGRVDSFVYSNGRELKEAGVIFLEDMLSETAFVKLGWVLGHKDWNSSREKVEEMMLKNFAGELSERLEE